MCWKDCVPIGGKPSPRVFLWQKSIMLGTHTHQTKETPLAGFCEKSGRCGTVIVGKGIPTTQKESQIEFGGRTLIAAIVDDNRNREEEQ